jgi:DnaJ-class molecular chaperone
MEKTYYETLGVTRNASPEEIKQKYRKLAMQHHPDRNPGDSTAINRYHEVTEAYEALMDPLKRSQYDLQGFVGRRQSPSPPPPRPYQSSRRPKRKETKRAEIRPEKTEISQEKLDSVQCQFFGGNDRVLLGRNILVTLILKRGELGRIHNVRYKKRLSCMSCEPGHMDGPWTIEEVAVLVPKDHASGNQIILKGKGEKGRGSGGIHGNLHVAVIIQ